MSSEKDQILNRPLSSIVFMRHDLPGCHQHRIEFTARAPASSALGKTLALTGHHSHTGDGGMIEFWRKLWQLDRPYKGRYFLGVLFGVLSGFADTVVLVTVTFVVTVVFSNARDENIERILQKLAQHAPWLADRFQHAQHWLAAHVSGSKVDLVLVVGLVPLVMLGRGVCNYLNNYLLGWVTIRAITDLRARVLDHLLNLPLSFLSRNSTGELMSRVGDVGVLQNVLGGSVLTLVKEPVSMISLLVTAFVVNANLTAIALVTFPFCAIPVAVYNRKMRKAGAGIQNEQAVLNRMMHETFTGNRIIKGYNLEQVVMERFRATQQRFISHFMRVIRSTETPGPLIEFLGAIGISILLLYLAGTTSPAAFIVFVGTLLLIYRPVKAIIRVQSQLHQARRRPAVF